MLPYSVIIEAIANDCSIIVPYIKHMYETILNEVVQTAKLSMG